MKTWLADLMSLLGLIVVGVILDGLIAWGYAAGRISPQRFSFAILVVTTVIALLAMARSYKRSQRARSSSAKVAQNLAALKPLILALLVIMQFSLFAGLWMTRNDASLVMVVPIAMNLAITWWLVTLLKKANSARE